PCPRAWSPAHRAGRNEGSTNSDLPGREARSRTRMNLLPVLRPPGAFQLAQSRLCRVERLRPRVELAIRELTAFPRERHLPFVADSAERRIDPFAAAAHAPQTCFAGEVPCS